MTEEKKEALPIPEENVEAEFHEKLDDHIRHLTNEFIKAHFMKAILRGEQPQPPTTEEIEAFLRKGHLLAI